MKKLMPGGNGDFGMVIMFVIMLIGFIIMLKYKNVGLLILLTGFSIGVYIIDFSSIENRFLGYLLSWLTIVFTVLLGYFIGNQVKFFKENPIVFATTVGPALQRVISAITKIIFKVPK